MTCDSRPQWAAIALVICVLSGCGPSAQDIGNGPDDATNSIGIKFKLIRPGKFLMGAPKNDAAQIECEAPQHLVEIAQPFYMGVYPVTRGQFAAFVEDAGYKAENEKTGDKPTWRNPHFKSYEASDDDPVVFVSWNDAGQFCKWLSKKENKTYELPTEAEWEYACRAGTTTAYSFGDDPKSLDDYAWYAANSDFQTHPVGGKQPNPWGLYDMHGNVCQWCTNQFGLYRSEDIRDQLRDRLSKFRIIRGGSFRGKPQVCRSTYRNLGAPEGSGDDVGFRVVLRSPPDKP